jgi:FkbM family methyltransferase
VPVDPPFVSYAQNREDVVLWRALGHVRKGRYVEVGANDPTVDSVTRAFYDRGWSGITVEPMHDYVQRHRTERPRDIQIEAVITDEAAATAVLHEIEGTGLSTIVDENSERHEAAGAQIVDKRVGALHLADIIEWHGGLDQEIHFMLIDVEGAEAKVLASVDLTLCRPWVVVVEATAPNSTTQTHGEWEPAVLDAGYEFCLFDGLSRFYVATERADALREALSYPACVLDNYQTHRYAALLTERADLRAQLIHWRAIALTRWAGNAAPSLQAASNETEAVRAELLAMQTTLSWRVTRPLRAVRGAVGRLAGR